ncbi:hypothetical protein GPZ77_28665 [Streptomyces sp. QHH-9511]|uniref:hypothetical protein n=1 Tax=Streptomyces sp. QHH-9511 TaxID=2684468 RepID=UPI0013191B5F|nr:hypothetical protein [Streptomyces sp. QHH-9511]QGZ51823.1 hypothetical protein GPZ77_28665 [Streptomyces sp. QHH-9511]
MRAIRAGSAALLATATVAAVSFGAPAAVADDGTGFGTGTGIETDPETETQIGIETEAGIETGTETQIGIETGTETQIGIETEAETETGTETQIGIETEAETETGIGTIGTESGITSFGFSVSPETVAPGGTVTLKSHGCQLPSVTVSSGVFDTVTLKEGHAGKATVDVDAKVGAEYVVTFDCKGEKGTTMLTIAGGSGHSTGGHSTGGHATGGESPSGHSTGGTGTGAHKGVRAGFGGGFGQFGTAETVVGSGLIAGALGGAVVLIRRRGAEGRV